MTAPRILLVGGGYVGLYAALRLKHRLRDTAAEITVVDPEDFMVYRPLLAEVASGTLEPRHAVVPLRSTLAGVRLLTGRLTGLDRERRVATVDPVGAPESALEVGYDHLVLGLGAGAVVPDLPGLAEHGIGFNSLAEATYLRDHVLDRLETAASTTDARLRRRALTFVFVGGGYTGVEALAELQDMAAHVLPGYPGVEPRELRWVLVEALDRILTTVPEELSGHALDLLRGRGIDVRLGTKLESAGPNSVTLSDGDTIPTETLVWVAGTAPNRLVGQLGLPIDEHHRLVVDDRLRVQDTPGVWAAGDCAAVPDRVRGGLCPPTAQHAVREARALADNLVATLRGEPTRAFRYRERGQFVTLGRHRAVAQVLGRDVTGLPAWLLRRMYYAAQIPTVNRKVRVSLDWLVGMPFGHDVVDLRSRERPRAAFEDAARH
jgi:NADH dehydrogenase